MEVEAMSWMVTRWEDNQKMAVALTDQESKMANVIRESRWNVRYEYDVNPAERHWTTIAKNFQRRSDSCCMGWGGALGTGRIMSCISPSS
jgi:hypothetical protein